MGIVPSIKFEIKFAIAAAMNHGINFAIAYDFNIECGFRSSCGIKQEFLTAIRSENKNRLSQG